MVDEVFFRNHEVGTLFIVEFLNQFVVGLIEVFCSLDVVSLEVYLLVYLSLLIVVWVVIGLVVIFLLLLVRRCLVRRHLVRLTEG